MSRFTSALIAALLGAVILSCDKSPTRPTPTPTNTPPTGTAAPTLLSIRIDGPTTVPPGETAQYSATGAMSDGTSRDVTGTVNWRTSDASILALSPTGLATAGRAGEVVVSADQSSRRTSRTVTVIPTGTFILVGTVREASFPISGATVSLLDGSRPVLSATTDAVGAYRLFGVAGDVEVRATKPGYTERVNRLIVSSQNRLSDFQLSQVTRTDVFGKYQLTVTAASQCSILPAEARVRTYDADIVQDGPNLKVTLSGGSLVSGNFVGHTQPDRVTFDIRGASSYYYYYFYFSPPLDVIDQLTANSAWTFAGHVTATISSSGLSGTLAGLVATVQSPIAAVPRLLASCTGGHSFVLTRR